MTEVLIVDDILKTAQRFATLVQRRTGLQCTATNDPQVALNLVQKGLVKVVLLDQEMPEMTGTELFKKLHAVNPRVKVVMLTGEAKARDVGDALKIGFHGYLEKGEVNELASTVLDQYLQYEIDSQHYPSSNTGELLGERKSWHFFRRTRVEFRLLSLTVIDSRYIKDDEWITVIQLNVGETKELTEKNVTTRTVKLENIEESQVKLGTKVGHAAIGQITASLERTIKRSSKEITGVEQSVERTEKSTYTLPPEPLDINSNRIVARHFQRAPIYRKWLAVIATDCNTCRSNSLVPLVLLEQTDLASTRQLNYLDDGTFMIGTAGEVRL